MYQDLELYIDGAWTPASNGSVKQVFDPATEEELGKIGDARAIEPLVGALGDEDEYEYVRGASAEALGKIGDARAIEPLVAALGLWNVSKPAAVALDRLGWQPGQDESAIKHVVIHFNLCFYRMTFRIQFIDQI